MQRNKKSRKIYESFYGKIPDGYELHHITPIFDGGVEDDLENMEILLPEQHAQRHLERYEKYGDIRDLCSYHMIGHNFTEAHRISSSEGGRIGGQITKERKTGIFRSDDERREWASLGGKASQKTLKEKQVSAFYDPNLRFDISSKGGKKGAFTQSKWQSEFGKRGGVKNKGFRWYNDGIKDYKYTPKMQEEVSFEEFLEQKPHFMKGRIKNKGSKGHEN